MPLQADCRPNECQGFKSGYDTLFKVSSELSKVYHDYIEKVNQCDPPNSEGCLLEVQKDLRDFLSVIDVLHQHQLLKSQYDITRHDFVLFLEEESSDIQLFLLDATRPYSRTLCKSKYENNRNKPTDRATDESHEQETTRNNYNEDSQRGEQSKPTSGDPDDMCSNTVSLETALRTFYLEFKDSFDRLQKYSQHAKAVILAKGNRSQVLSSVNQALHNYFSTLRCDWQAIATKYAMLRFQHWNLKLVTHFMNENSRVVSISDFASLRMNRVLIEPSEDLLKLVLKLASENSSELFDDLDYLTMLKYRKPPLWKGIFDVW